MSTTFIFDIGNVVWSYKPSLDQLLHRWTNLSGLPYEEFYAHYISFYKYFETNQKTLDDFVVYLYQNDPKPYWQALADIYTDNNFNQNLNLPLLNLITNLRSSFKVGYLSNGENFFKEYIYSRISPNFDFGYTSYDLGLEKPNPEIFTKVLKLQNLKPDEVIYIDDVPQNVTSAQSVGIKCLLFETNAKLLTDLQKINNIQ